MVSGANFEISNIFSAASETIGKNLGLYLGLSLLLAGSPTFLLYWWQGQFVTTGDPRELFAIYTSSAFLRPAALVWLISMITHAALQAGLARATTESLSGQAVSAVDTLETGFALLLPVFAIGLILTIGTFLASLLFVVPGVILWLCWCVAIPAYVAERPGVMAAFGRSLALTRGERGNIFVIMLVVVIGVGILGGVAGFTVGMVMGRSLIVTALVQAFVAGVSSMVSATVLTTVYVALVKAKEGPARAELETVFT